MGARLFEGAFSKAWLLAMAAHCSLAIQLPPRAHLTALLYAGAVKYLVRTRRHLQSALADRQ